MNKNSSSNSRKNFLIRNYLPLHPSDRVIYFSLFVICMMGAIIRIQDINHSLYLDEIATTWVIKGSFSEIFECCWTNNLSPMYYIIIYGSKTLLGFSESALRIPSIIAGVFSIPFIYLITKELSRSNLLAIFASLLSAIDPTLIGYSQEVRPYALVILLSLLSFYLFLLYLKNERNNYYVLFLGMINGILILLHYTAGIICIVQLVVAVVYFLINGTISKTRIRGLFIYILIICIFLLPFIKHLNYLFSNRDILSNYLPDNIKVNILLRVMLPPLMGYIVAPFLSALLVEFWNKDKVSATRDFPESFKIRFLLAWYFIPLIFFWVLSGLDILHMLFPRYLVLVIPAQIIGSAVLIGSFSSKCAKFIYVVTLLFFTQIVSQNSTINNFKIGNNEKHWEWGEYVDKSDFGWKEAVNNINNSGIFPTKVYVRCSLTETQLLNNGSPADSLLNDYLLSTVNSIYKIEESLLLKAVPIHSALDISEDDSNYLLVGPGMHYMIQYMDGLTELSPDNAYVNIYYKK